MSIGSPFTTRRLSATALTLCAVLAVPVGAQESAEPRIEQIVAARIGLKKQVALFMTQIEGPASEGATLDQRAAYANAIGAILDAFPHLFPAASSPQGLAAAGQVINTSAAPAIWDDIDAFHARAAATADQARTVAQAPSLSALVEAASELRATCTACHDSYLDWQMSVPDLDGASVLDNLGF